eukprot:CAMPEP_0184753044 /NCGR_PEP_ID=MMETSP0315-20130426/43896_1 /TAXON_ID=101924 /ORGANISM="Rhodosorus marinus, Strain UTEX LB 2760" /LENGTH=408 /DNA_ID=CAMNT_0027232407 /DNA_START=574 /DNA_END=1800 /DNA_ORIENTATION=+
MSSLGFVGGYGGLVRSRNVQTTRRSRVLRSVIEAKPTETVQYKIPDSESAFRSRPVKVLPDGVSLTDVVRTMPKEVFEIDERKSWLHVLVTAVAVPLSLVAVHFSPWYLLPFAWFLAGTAATGIFVIGHDAGHNSFSKNQKLNDIVGNASLSMLIYPFEPWRIQHNIHHRNTNMLRDRDDPDGFVADNAWQPLQKSMFRGLSRPKAFVKALTLVWTTLWYQLSILHWVNYHFNPKKFTKKQLPKVKVSWLCCAIFAGIAFPTLFAIGGPWAFVKFWLMPWLGYHFWMSAFTLIHHTAPHIQFTEKSEWNAAKAQLSGTVHCDFPRWIEILCHDINVHIPHHVSTRIPSYNLKAAHESIRKNWGPYINETSFSLKLCDEIVSNCHVYDDGEYVTYDEAERRVATQLSDN